MRTCIIGIGNELRRDDAIGIEIVKGLQSMSVEMDLIRFSDSFFELPEILRNYDIAFIIDAFPPAGSPGRLSILQSVVSMENGHHSLSLHDMELCWSLQYAYRKGFSGKVFLIGVEAEDLSWGVDLSLALTKRLPSLVQEIKAFILGELSSAY